MNEENLELTEREIKDCLEDLHGCENTENQQAILHKLEVLSKISADHTKLTNERVIKEREQTNAVIIETAKIEAQTEKDTLDREERKGSAETERRHELLMQGLAALGFAGGTAASIAINNWAVLCDTFSKLPIQEGMKMLSGSLKIKNFRFKR